MVLTATDGKPPIRRRTRRNPKPLFKPDVSRQLDVVHGSPELQVGSDHLARGVREIIEQLDTSELEAQYSSLGRHGFHPRCTLAVWVYASLVGLHESTKLALALQTDAALRLLSGGHDISAGTLRRFRLKNRAFFEAAIAQTVVLADERGMLHPEQLGVDSVRLRAHASTSAVRTLVRSRKRLADLAVVELGGLSEDDRARHETKLEKHRHAVARCEADGRTNFVVTNPSAGLIKFPDGGSAPGHRITVVAAGVQERLVVTVLMDADGHDFGKTSSSLLKVRALFERLRIRNAQGLQVALDAGYWSEVDLQFAADNSDWVDVLIAERSDDRPGVFGRSKFVERDDGTIHCPAGREMRGPYSDGKGRGQRYEGQDCGTCPLKARCTPAATRCLVIRRDYDKLRNRMRERMARPDARARYNKRIATVEPVFSNLQATMKYRRATTRHERGIAAEILLKLLAHNISRLIARRALSRVRVVVNVF